MVASDSGGSEEPRSVLVDCLEDPDYGKRRLPSIVGLLDHDERATRVAAAGACCLVAVTDEDTVEYLVRRLGDRLDGDVSLEVTQTLDYLAAAYPEQVERIRREMREEGESPPFPAVGNFTRSHYYGGRTEADRDGVGRTRIAGSGESGDRRMYADREREEREQVAHERERELSDDEDPDDAEEPDENPAAMTRRTSALASLAVHSRFDTLHIVGASSRGRYANTYQALLGRGGDERAVAIRVFRRPDSTDGRPEFVDGLAARVADWTRVHDHDHVVTVLDWNKRPRPWLATPFTDGCLADRDEPRAEQALEDARTLAGAVAHLHQQGVVHGGIDPENVVYPGEVMDETQTRSPLLDNVGLLHVFRYHFEPALCLSPRYAAPEYFDDRFGTVDHETDIYQLGAVLFRLFTGQPPYTGDFQTVREAVVDGDPPRPSAVADVPDGIDEVISKAMATQKLTRYETVEHMQTELAGISDG